MNPTVIAIDIGNTNTSIGLIDTINIRCHEKLVFPSHQKPEIFIDHIKNFISTIQNNKPHSIHICSVVPSFKTILPDIKNTFSKDYSISVLSHDTKLPFTINYDKPKSLGMDRIADFFYAYKKYPNNDCIIIDAGTAITIDLLITGGEFKGGFILPGPLTQLKSLYNNTSQLPLIKDIRRTDKLYPPQSTNNCIWDGVLYSLAGGIASIVNKLLTSASSDCRILACGGAWDEINKFREFDYIEVPDLTLIGIGVFCDGEHR